MLVKWAHLAAMKTKQVQTGGLIVRSISAGIVTHTPVPSLRSSILYCCHSEHAGIRDVCYGDVEVKPSIFSRGECLCPGCPVFTKAQRSSASDWSCFRFLDKWTRFLPAYLKLCKWLCVSSAVQKQRWGEVVNWALCDELMTCGRVDGGEGINTAWVLFCFA